MNFGDNPPNGFVRSKTTKGVLYPIPSPNDGKIKALQTENKALREDNTELRATLKALAERVGKLEATNR